MYMLQSIRLPRSIQFRSKRTRQFCASSLHLNDLRSFIDGTHALKKREAASRFWHLVTHASKEDIHSLSSIDQRKLLCALAKTLPASKSGGKITAAVNNLKAMGVRWTEDDYVDGLAVSTEKGVLELLNAMQASSVTLSSNSCLKLLKAFEKESKSVQSAELGRFMLENGHAFEVKAVDSVILAHIKTSNVTGAMSFLQELVDKNKKSLELGDRSGCVAKSPSLSVLNKLIHLACEQGRMGDAKSLFNLMIQNAVMPTLETMTYLLKGFANADDVNGVELIHKRLAFFKMKPDLVFLTILASAYISAGQMSEAQRILDDLKTLKISPDAFFFNALLNGYGKLGDLHSMQKTYFSMVEEGVDPDEATFTIIIDAHMRAGDIRTALVWMESTLGLTPPQNVSFKPHKPTKPSMHSFSAIINGFSSSQRLELAQTWFDRMVEHGLPPNQIVYTALIRGYIRSRKVKIARKLQEDMATAGLKQDIKLFNIMIYSQTWFNDFKKAFMTLKSMKQIGVKPDAITYGILIDGLLKFKHFKRAVEVFAEMREIGLKPTLHTYIAIITTLGHYGGFGIIESSPKDKEHGPIREVGSGDTLKVSQETSQETVVNSRPSLLDSRLQVREDLQAVYISYRDHVHASNIDPILDIYDAVMASHINTGDVESAFEVLIDAIKDNCIIDTSLVVRLAKGVGFRRGWRGILAISQKAKQMAYLRLAYSSPLDGIREDLSLGTVPTVEDEKDEKKKGVAGKFNFHRHWADEIPLMLVEVLIAAYPFYGFKKRWKKVLMEEDTGMKQLLYDAKMLRYERTNRRYFVFGKLKTEEGVEHLWNLVLKVNRRLPPDTQDGDGTTEMSPAKRSLKRPVAIQSVFGQEFTHFCMLFLHHCEQHMLLRTHTKVLDWLDEEGVYLDDAMFRTWIRWKV